MPAAEFIPSFLALLSHILCPDYPDPGYSGVIRNIHEVSFSAMQIWKYHGFT